MLRRGAYSGADRPGITTLEDAQGLVAQRYDLCPGTAYLFPTPDGFYQALIDAHRDLDDEASQMVNAKLALLLANHIGDLGCCARRSRWRAPA